MRKLSTALVISLLGGALLAGCGSGKSTSTSNTASRSARSTEAHKLTPQERVAACKRAVLAPSALSASVKAKLEKSCDKAATATGEREVIHEVCSAFAARLPAGPNRELALVRCRVP